MGRIHRFRLSWSSRRVYGLGLCLFAHLQQAARSFHSTFEAQVSSAGFKAQASITVLAHKEMSITAWRWRVTLHVFQAIGDDFHHLVAIAPPSTMEGAAPKKPICLLWTGDHYNLIMPSVRLQHALSKLSREGIQQ